MRFYVVMIFVLSISINSIFSQVTNEFPRFYTIHKTEKPPIIDGKISTNEWKNLSWSESFVDIADSIHVIPPFETRFNMMWDDQYIYIAASLKEKDIWATLTHHDDIIYRDHDFEVFIDPNNDGEQYFEIEINAFNAVMDLFMNKPYKKKGIYNLNWDAQGLITAIKINGTINNNQDIDTGWTIEMAIPFDCMKREGRIYHPKAGSTWRINFSRVEWPLEKKDTYYQKAKDIYGKNKAEKNWVWSRIGISDMHIPEKWGYLYFK